MHENQMSRLTADYDIETPLTLEQAATVMAGEQSSGTFVRLPGETDALRERHGARIESITETGRADQPSLPSKLGTGQTIRGRVRLSWPLENMGPSLTNTLATVAGNLFELREISALRLLDVDFPEAFADACPGPAFGAAGTRRLAGVEGGPLIATIIKPSVGLNPEQTAALAGQLAEGGIDFIKDDELQANGSHCPFDERVKAVMAVLDAHADSIGKKVMYAFNVTGEVDEMKRNHDLVLEAGGTCVMVSLHSVGLAGLGALRRHCALPIHGHRNGWGLYSRSPDIGISYVAWQKFWRLAGADHMHVNGLSNKFSESDATVIESARACGTPLFASQPYTAMPVFSAGQTALQAPATYAALGHTDLIYCAGGGIIGHPDGVASGVASLREAWQAATEGQPLERYAETHPALSRALEAFGSRMT